jgi:hypothetical protein
MLYLTLKYIHVLLAVAVGFNLAYGPIISRAKKTGVPSSPSRSGR